MVYIFIALAVLGLGGFYALSTYNNQKNDTDARTERKTNAEKDSTDKKKYYDESSEERRELGNKIDETNSVMLSKLTEIQKSIENKNQTEFQKEFASRIKIETGYEFEEIKEFLRDIVSNSSSVGETGLAFFNLLNYEKSKALLFEEYLKGSTNFSNDYYFPLVISCTKTNDLTRIVHIGNTINSLDADAFESVPRDVLSSLTYFATELGNIDLASKLIKRALEIEPNEPSSRFIKGYILEKNGEFLKAIEEYQFAFENESNMRNALRRIASCYRSINDIENAIESSQKGIQLYPDDFYFQYNIGATYTDLTTTPEKALPYFDAAGKISEVEIIYSGKALALKKLEKNEEALLEVNKAIELNPNNPENYNLRGQIYHQMGNATKVEEDRIKYEKLINQKLGYKIDVERK